MWCCACMSIQPLMFHLYNVDPHFFIGWRLKRICRMAHSLGCFGVYLGKDQADISKIIVSDDDARSFYVDHCHHHQQRKECHDFENEHYPNIRFGNASAVGMA